MRTRRKHRRAALPAPAATLPFRRPTLASLGQAAPWREDNQHPSPGPAVGMPPLPQTGISAIVSSRLTAELAGYPSNISARFAAPIFPLRVRSANAPVLPNMPTPPDVPD